MPKPKFHIIIILLLIPLALSSCLDKKFNPGILDDESVSIESDVTYDTDSLYIDINIINNEDFDIVYPAFEIHIVDRRISFFDFFTMLDNAFVFEFARCDLDIEHTHTSSICYHFEEIPRLCNIKPKDTLHLRVNLPRNMPDDIEDYQKRKKNNKYFEEEQCKQFKLKLCLLTKANANNIWSQKVIEIGTLDYHITQYFFGFKVVDTIQRSREELGDYDIFYLGLLSKNYTHHFALSFEY